MRRLIPLVLLLLSMPFAVSVSAQDGTQDPPRQDDNEVRVIRLEYQRGTSLENTLRNFLREDLQSKQQAQAGRPDGVRPRSIVVVAHDASNSMIVSAAKADMPTVLQLIASLDVPEGAARSPEATEKLGVRIDDESVELVPAASGSASLEELVAALRSVDGVAVQYTDAELTRVRIPLVGSVKVPRGQFFALFQELIHAAGIGCVARPAGTSAVVEVARVLNAQEPFGSARFVPVDRLEGAAWQGSHVFTAVQLGHLDAADAANQLRSLLRSQQRPQDDVHVAALAESRTVLLSGFVPRVQDAVALLRSVDVPRAPVRRSVVRALEHVDAAEVAVTLVTLFGGRGEDEPAVPFRAAACGGSRIAIAGPSATVDEALELLGRIDVANPAR